MLNLQVLEDIEETSSRSDCVSGIGESDLSPPIDPGDPPSVAPTRSGASMETRARIAKAVRVMATVLYLFGLRKPCKYCLLLDKTGREFLYLRFDKQQHLHHGRMPALATYGQSRASRLCP